MKLFAAAGLLVLCAIPAANATDPVLPVFGTLNFGDTFAKARAATPGVVWRDGTVSKVTGDVLSIEATDAIEFAGKRYDVSIQPQYYGGYVLGLKRGVAGADANACEQQLVELIEGVESQLGPFSGRAEMLDRERISEPGAGSLGGDIVWSPQDHPESIVRVGEKSTLVTGDVVGKYSVKRLKNGTQPDVRLLRARSEIAGADAPPIIVAAKGDFWRTHAVSCTVSLELGRAPKVPAPEVMAFGHAALRHAGSIARRHRVLSGLPPLPAQGLQFAFQCDVQRGQGRTQNCQSTGSAEPHPYFGFAKRWAEAAEFDFSGTQIDRNDPRLLSITIPIEMRPTDIRNIDFLGAPAIEVDAMSFTRKPTFGADAFYPPKAKRDGVQGVVTLACQVQVDYSILCGPRAGTTQPDPDLVDAAVKLAESFEAARTFPDGKTTAGQVFIRTVKFSISES